MMNREQFLLTKLAEEASEVAQMALKTQQFGLDEKKDDEGPTNRERLNGEISDFQSIVAMLNTECNLNYTIDLEKMGQKFDRVNKYYNYSASLGNVVALNNPLGYSEVEMLKLEIEYLRRFGNKDCTGMADEELSKFLSSTGLPSGRIDLAEPI